MHSENFLIADIDIFKQKVLNWLKPFGTFCFLDSNKYSSDYELLVGAGAARAFASSAPNALQQFQSFINEKQGWLFGHFGYELNTDDNISRTAKIDLLGFDDIFFFEPEIIISVTKKILTIHALHPQNIFEAIHTAGDETNIIQKPVVIQNKISKEKYINIIDQLKSHIQRGDCYEINFCQEFYAEDAIIDPLLLFKQLTKISPNPFSGLYKTGKKWLICASPERYIKKTADKIISQPIKGTLPRNIFLNNIKNEQRELLQSVKDRAENVMVVDLVRNDLSKVCVEGSVQVNELFGIYSFPQLHQMISTVSGKLKASASFSDIINGTFPMGSMTGAPKIKVMDLIERYEKSKRGIYSGSLGYIDPFGDFDFNVVIRSIAYNQNSAYLSFQTGGGITTYSKAESEWDECMLKAKAIKEILNV